MEGRVPLLILAPVCAIFICTILASKEPEWDDRGYILFCLCMGRFGNQADHFLGGLHFAKLLDRTLILPPWRTYKNVPFTEWFQLEALSEYHRVITAEEFMVTLAPSHWPPGNRTGYCFAFSDDNPCQMKRGNPFGPFWDGLGVDFDREENMFVSYSDPKAFAQRFPAATVPVIALKGAPAPFPVISGNRHLQKYLRWSEGIIQQGQTYIKATFPDRKFIGLHLRNGIDWENACKHISQSNVEQLMASPQCVDPRRGDKLTMDICLPDTQLVLQQTEKLVAETGIKVIYTATDKNPLIKELQSELKKYEVELFHQDPWLPQIDLYILGQSDYFIGNCVSSFTSFVIRERSVHNKPSSFWGM